MPGTLRNIIVCISAQLLAAHSYAQIQVLANQNATTLANKLAGQGVTVYNATLHCASVANGLFTVTSSNIGIDSGIVLTNGRAATVGTNYGINGPQSYFASTDDGMPGDPALDALAGQTTQDACSLEFDVIPNGDTIKFNYVFSSEEYKNAVCGPYNDAFAFFISGAGIAGTDNMALVPGTNIPVTINSINNGIPGSAGSIGNCTKMGPGSPFTAYYIDNSNGTTLTHYGMTTVLQATHAVVPCSSYHLKLVIADAGDPLYDSGVFLEAGSLQTGNYNIRAVTTMIHDTSTSICVKGCLPGQFNIRRSKANTKAQTIKYIISGTAMNGVDYSAIPDSAVIPAGDTVAHVIINGLPTSPAGPRIVKLYIMSPINCAGGSNIIDSAAITIYDTLHITIETPDTAVCSNDTTLMRVSGPNFLSYSWTPPETLSDPTAMSPAAFPASNTTYTVSGFLPGTSCMSNTPQISFTIKLTPGVALPADTSVCYNTGLTLDPTIDQPNPYYSYQWTGPDNYRSDTLSPALSKVSWQMQGAYKITVVNDTNGCRASAIETVNVTTPDTPAVTSPLIVCANTAAQQLVINGTDVRWYRYVTDSTPLSEPPILPTNVLNKYVYYVTQTVNGCESPKEKINAKVEICCDGKISVPNAFTPNNDGKNDKFEIYPDYGYTVEQVSVFDRWGQLVYSGRDAQWDGTVQGSKAEMGTYYYSIVLKCILGSTVTVKGDVILIR